VPPRVGPCLSKVAPPRRQGELRGFPAIRHLRRSRGRGAVLSHVATQVPAAHRHGDRQARAGPGRTALGVSDGEGMRVAQPRRGEGRLVTHIGGGLERVRVFLVLKRKRYIDTR
jgi:hypothetical protein